MCRVYFRFVSAAGDFGFNCFPAAALTDRFELEAAGVKTAGYRASGLTFRA